MNTETMLRTNPRGLTDAEIDEIMNDSDLRELFENVLKFDDTKKHAMVIFVNALADGKSSQEAAKLAAVNIDTCPGSEV